MVIFQKEPVASIIFWYQRSIEKPVQGGHCFTVTWNGAGRMVLKTYIYGLMEIPLKEYMKKADIELLKSAKQDVRCIEKYDKELLGG